MRQQGITSVHRGRALAAAASLTLVAALVPSPAAAQRVAPALWTASAAPAASWSADSPAAAPPRPPLTSGVVTMQLLSGAGGGLAGAFAGFLPFALAGIGGRGVNEDAAAVAGVVGYFVGTATGVQLYGRSAGMRGSWKATFGGAAVGLVGGPAVLVTFPVGAVVGYNRTREYRTGTVAGPG